MEQERRDEAAQVNPWFTPRLAVWQLSREKKKKGKRERGKEVHMGKWRHVT